MKHILLKILFGVVLVPNFGVGQVNSSFKAWLETQVIDQKLTISGWALNESSKAQRLFYSITLRKDGIETTREGATLTLPGQPNLLLKTVFVIQEAGFESVHLTLKDHEKIVATAHLAGPPQKSEAPPELVESPADEQIARLSFNDLEIEGLIIDDTRSKLAHDFYELFYNHWSSVELPAVNATITIRELPARIGIGTRIVVEVDDEELTQLNLHPRADMVESLALQLAESLLNYFNSPDRNNRELNPEELNGTGIY